MASCPRSLGEHRVGQQLTGCVVAPRAQVVFVLLHTGQDGVEDVDRLGDLLGSDPVAADHREFHDRSTTSSLLATTAVLISERTSAGDVAVDRSRIVGARPRGVLGELCGLDVHPGGSRAGCRSCPGRRAVVDS